MCEACGACGACHACDACDAAAAAAADADADADAAGRCGRPSHLNPSSCTSGLARACATLALVGSSRFRGAAASLSGAPA
eukprot:1584201-Rhodomonas_salina.1